MTTATTVNETLQVPIDTSADRREIIRRITSASAFSWIVFQLLMFVLFGPHISVMRGVTIGASVGAAVGLFFSFVQWQSLRRYVPDVVWWIPATTLGMTFGGAIGNLANYYAIQGTDVYLSAWQAGGLLSGILSGLLIAGSQWLVVHNWTTRSGDWFINVILGLL
ncbi:MAG: hypothetical protein ABI670_06020 [Chloroflexota bacterium]